MTATQVFLRFIKEEYTKPNGEIDELKYVSWMNVLSTAKFIKRKYHFWLYNFSMKNGWQYSIYRTKGGNTRDFVDAYLLGQNSTLRAFLPNIIRFESGWHRTNKYVDYLCKLYYTQSHYYGLKKEGTKILLDKWYNYIDNHISGETKKKFSIKNCDYTFEYVD